MGRGDGCGVSPSPFSLWGAMGSVPQLLSPASQRVPAAALPGKGEI